MSKTIIIYFSYTGNTRKIANYIKEKLNCDILELKPKVPYSTNYDEVVEEEQNLEGSNHTPEIKEININLNNYEQIILGTPVWWYRESPVIRTFLKNNDLSNKTIVPFATNAGWLGQTFDAIKKECPNSKVTDEMNIVFESYSDKLKTPIEDVNSWINKLK